MVLLYLCIGRLYVWLTSVLLGLIYFLIFNIEDQTKGKFAEKVVAAFDVEWVIKKTQIGLWHATRGTRALTFALSNETTMPSRARYLGLDLASGLVNYYCS